MKRTIAAASHVSLPSGLLWALLAAGEISVTASLLLTDRVPSLLLHAFQLFLRF
jgi:hypothetical protein